MNKDIENKIIVDNNALFSHIEEMVLSGESVILRIKGRSMFPTLVEGDDKVVLSPLSRQQLYIGAIALFCHNNQYVLHRLMSINDNVLTFQGDNLHSCSENVLAPQVIAIVEHIIKSDSKIVNCFDEKYKQKAKSKVYKYQFYNKLRMLLKG